MAVIHEGEVLRVELHLGEARDLLDPRPDVPELALHVDEAIYL